MKFMPIHQLSAVQQFVDWFNKVSPTKKIYCLITIMAIGFTFFLKYYDGKISTITKQHNTRIDSLTVFYTNALENCNSENKAEYKNILSILQKSLNEQQKLQMETEKLKIETEKLKQKK